jgi:YD repeat-containing protein
MVAVWRNIAAAILITIVPTIKSASQTRAISGAFLPHFAPLLQGPTAGPVNYVYDELGRLIAAIDASGNAAAYSYDAAGNILSIQRYLSSDLSVISFTPSRGSVGTIVNISGTGFSSVISNNTVQFNGVSASITSSSTNLIVATVPTGATTGPITVTSPQGSLTTANSFTVTSSDGRPRIDSFTPQIASAGTAVNLNGANFDPLPSNNHLILNATGGLVPSASTSTSMTMTAPAATSSGHIALSTSNGTVTSTGDLFIPPTNYSVGAVGFTGRTIPGTGVSVSLGVPNQIGLLLFDGTKGQKVSATASGGSTFTSCNFFIYDPTNTAILDARSQITAPAAGSCAASGGLLYSQKLPSTGTYALVAVPGTSTGHATLTPYLFNDISATLTPGGSPFTVATSFPGQNGVLTFTGLQNGHVSISVPASTFNGCDIDVLNPDGTTLATVSSGCNKFSSFYDVPYLSQAGRYTLLIDPPGVETGNVTIKLNDATDVTGPITTDGTPVMVTTTVPGQNGKLTFSGVAGQKITAVLDNNTYGSSSISMSILSPNGTRFSASSPSSASQFIDDTQYCIWGFIGYVCGSITLPTTGTYTLFWIQGPQALGTHEYSSLMCRPIRFLRQLSVDLKYLSPLLLLAKTAK